MDFGTAVKTCFSKYATFSGRAPRSEYWWFTLAVVIVNVVLRLVDHLAFEEAGVLSGLWSLAILLPSLAVGARRLHDLDRTGWWLLLIFVPILGWIILLIWDCTPGTKGANQYGPDPLG
ncbi:MAG TPA: DUF805 domain-containing protein [Pseudolabrys sp.]|nr:DUF805 domain-containing protein [Pseudolabrys sp.]